MSGTSVGRMTRLICSMLCRSGLNPPCIVKIFSSMMAAIGRQLKQSVNVFHNLMLYRRLPAWSVQGVSTPGQQGSGRERRGSGRTLVVKAVNPVDRRALVVAAEDEKVLGVFDLVGEEEADGFERLLASVDVIAEEEVVGFGRETAVLEQAQQVVVLSVDVTCTSTKRLHQHLPAPSGGPDKRQETVDANAPQILIGASSSSRMGWLIKISRAFVQRNLISYSCSCTCLPGRFPRTAQAGGRTSVSTRQQAQTSGLGCSGCARARVNPVPPCSMQCHAATRSNLQELAARQPAG